MIAFVQKIVEPRPARALLQPVDTAKAPVVGQNHRKGQRHHDRRRQFGIGHHIAAIPNHADHIGAGQRHLDPQSARNLITHAGKAVFHVIAALRGIPDLVQLARHRPRRAHHDRIAPGRALNRADYLPIGRQGIAIHGRRFFRSNSL